MKKGLVPIDNFSTFWQDELTANVQIIGNDVLIKRFDLNPAKQLFWADRIRLFELGKVIADRCWKPERQDCEELISLIGLDEYNPYEIVMKTHGRMAQDPIWFRFEGESLTFEEVKNIRSIIGK